jgi:hypothetical protein
LHNAGKLAGKRGNPGKVAGLDRSFFDKRSSHAQRTRSGLEKFDGGIQINPTRRHETNLRQRATQRLEMGRAANFRREDFHDVRPRLPRGQNFRRRERSTEDGLAIPTTLLDYGQADDGRNHVLRTGKNSDSGRFGVENGSCPDQSPIAQPIGDPFENLVSAGNRERDFGNVDAAFDKRLGDIPQYVTTFRAYYSDDPTAEYAFKRQNCAHRRLSRPDLRNPIRWQ